jgi:hypothetical protein
MFVLISIITPSIDGQVRGWRRTRKLGRASLSFLEEAATSFWFVIVMALAAGAGWYLFTKALVESRWFPGHEVPLRTLGFYLAVMLTGGIGFQALLEGKGGRALGLVAILVGAVPIMAGTVLGSINNRMIPLALWMAGVSPASMPFYAPGTLLSLSELPVEAARAVPRAFYFWLFVSALVAMWLAARLRTARKRIADRTSQAQSIESGTSIPI